MAFLARLVVVASVGPALGSRLADAPTDIAKLKETVTSSQVFEQKVTQACQNTHSPECHAKATDKLFCQLLQRSRPTALADAGCEGAAPALLQVRSRTSGPEDDLAQEMTHDLEMNFNKIAPFGKEDTAKELQDHAAKTQDTLVDAVENAEVAEIKRAVFRALTRLRAATIKEFDTIARLETQAIDAYNDAHHYRAENPLAHLLVLSLELEKYHALMRSRFCHESSMAALENI